MSASTAKKKPRNQASSATGESAGYQDSFQSMVTDPSDAKPGPRKATTKKTTGSSPPRATESDTQQQQRDFKFVVEGQDKAKSTKPVAFEVLPPFQVKSPAQAQSPSQDTPGEDTLEQDAPESSPTPDFERNADGKTTHSGMILFIPQESSSSTSSPQTQSQAASATTTPSGNTLDDPFASSPSQTPVPSGYETTPVPTSAAGLSLESNDSTPRSSTPVGLYDSNRISSETHVDDRDRDKDKDKAKPGSKKDKGATNVRTPVATAPQTIVPSKRTMVEQQQQQRSHTASPTPRIPPLPSSTHLSGNKNNASTNGTLRTGSSTGYHSDDSSRYRGEFDRDQESLQELDASMDHDDETDEMRMRREAALTMASFKDLIRVEQPQPHQQQQPSSGPSPAPSSGYYAPQQQQQHQHGGHSYPNNNSNYGQSPHMYPPPPAAAGHHHLSYPPSSQPQQQQASNKYWNDDNDRGGPSPTGPPPPPSSQTAEANKTSNNSGYHQHPPTSSPSATPSSVSRVMAMNSAMNSNNQHSQRWIGGASPFDALYATASGGSKGYFGQPNDLDEDDPRNMFHEERHGSSGLYHARPPQRGPPGPTPHSHCTGQR
ncbi:hypothetical protein BGW39_003515 [Mortierella sp. 14UC]|nr:hypothetical protein BGW39_003515 [Mortierella sp. 14UC]